METHKFYIRWQKLPITQKGVLGFTLRKAQIAVFKDLTFMLYKSVGCKDYPDSDYKHEIFQTGSLIECEEDKKQFESTKLENALQTFQKHANSIRKAIKIEEKDKQTSIEMAQQKLLNIGIVLDVGVEQINQEVKTNETKI